MMKLKKISIGLLLALVLMVSALIISFTGASEYAMAAASSTPKTTVNKVTLYMNYKIYQIKFEKLSRSAVVTFKSSNPEIAKVSNSGIITPKSTGSAIITVTMKQNKKTYTSKFNVTVSLSNLKILDKTGALAVGDTYTFKAVANGINGAISWSVSDQSIAKIDEKSGKLTALGKGEVDAIVTAGGFSSSCTVVISDPKLTTALKDIVCDDETIVYIKAVDLLSNEKLNYSIDNNKIVECIWGDWEGDKAVLLIKPIAEGYTKVTITSSKNSDKLTLNVTVIKKSDERDPEAKELTAKEIYSKVAPATVKLQITKADGDMISSGFFIASGVLITNYHAIEGATDITVTTNNKKEYDINEILGYDEETDLAVLSIDAITEHLRLYGGNIAVGEKVYAIGSPHGVTGALSNGIVSSDSRMIDGMDCVQITAPITDGNSGGPLINAYGEVMGINTSITLDGQKLNSAVNVYQYLKLNLKDEISADVFYEANKNREESDSELAIVPTLSPIPVPVTEPIFIPITPSPDPITTPSPVPVTTPSPTPITTPSPIPGPDNNDFKGTCYCGFVTYSKSEWEEHQKNHVSSDAVKCSRCGDYYDPSKHIHTCYLKGEFCPWCGGIEENTSHSSNSNK